MINTRFLVSTDDVTPREGGEINEFLSYLANKIANAAIAAFQTLRAKANAALNPSPKPFFLIDYNGKVPEDFELYDMGYSRTNVDDF